MARAGGSAAEEVAKNYKGGILRALKQTLTAKCELQEMYKQLRASWSLMFIHCETAWKCKVRDVRIETNTYEEAIQTLAECPR